MLQGATLGDRVSQPRSEGNCSAHPRASSRIRTLGTSPPVFRGVDCPGADVIHADVDVPPEQVVEMYIVPCVLKKPSTNELVHGRALRRNDGFLLAMLDLPTGDIAFEGFIHGRFVGREEERNRTRQFFHEYSQFKNSRGFLYSPRKYTRG
jgi:hypothetical protein